MMKSFFKSRAIRSEIRKCRSVDPSQCRYHSLYTGLAAAVEEKDMSRYLDLKTAISEANREAELKGFIDESSISSEPKSIIDKNEKTEKSLAIGDFLTDDKGIIQVYSKDTISFEKDYSAMYAFGEFTDLETAKQLHQDDPYKKLQNGDCADLAHELYNNNPYVVNISEVNIGERMPGMEEDESIHVIALLKDGNYVDSLGIWSKETMEAAWKQIDPTSRVTDFPSFEKKKPSPNNLHPINNTIRRMTDAYFENKQ
jgi:hypothetical protein